MSRIKRWTIAAATAVALVGGSAALVGTAGASVASPHVAPIAFTNNGVGEAGVLLTDDGHTKYRFVQSATQAEPLLATLNDVTVDGASGDELCNPDTGFAAQDGLFYDASTQKYYVGWADGFFNADAVNDDVDVCATGGLLDAITENASGLPSLSPAIPTLPPGDGLAGPNTVFHSGIIPVTVKQGDKILTALYYTPSGRSHSITFTVSDKTTGWIRNPQVRVGAEEFWEAGSGIFTPTITTNAFNAVEPITETSVDVNFYSSLKPAYGIFAEKAYYGTGGVTEVSATNGLATIAPAEVSPDSFTLTSAEN